MEDVNQRSVRLHRLQKLRMAKHAVCRDHCPVCRLIRKGELNPKRHGIRPKRSWKNKKTNVQYKDI